MLVLTGCRKGQVPRALLTGGPAAAAARAGPADRPVRRRARRGGADRPRRPVRRRTQRRPRRAGPRGRPAGGGDQQRALRRPRPAPAGHRARRRPGPPVAWTRSTGGCRPRRPPTCAAGRRWRSASPTTPSAVANARPARRRARLRPRAWSRRGCPTTRSPSRGTPRCRGCASSPTTAPWTGTAPASSAPTRTGRSTASST